MFQLNFQSPFSSLTNLCPRVQEQVHLKDISLKHFLGQRIQITYPKDKCRYTAFRRLESKGYVQETIAQSTISSVRFWNRWKQEYLHILQPGRNWQYDQNNLNPGDIVLLKDPRVTETTGRLECWKTLSVEKMVVFERQRYASPKMACQRFIQDR